MYRHAFHALHNVRRVQGVFPVHSTSPYLPEIGREKPMIWMHRISFRCKNNEKCSARLLHFLKVTGQPYLDATNFGRRIPQNILLLHVPVIEAKYSLWRWPKAKAGDYCPKIV